MLKCQLAKVYGKDKTPKSHNGYFITEKLDGNRCIAEFNEKKWTFTSRNGKELNVDFDLSTFNKNRIYDGEIITVEQYKDRKKTDFNTLNGLIQRQGIKKPLVYVIFDIQDTAKTYAERRKELDTITNTENAFILPILAHFKTEKELNDNIPELLNKITDNGGEGLIINNGDAVYKTTRTNDLLKVKNNYTIDLQVIDIEHGKHADKIGALKCKTVADGKTIITDIGAGFTDEQRREWHKNPELIKNKIIEVKYFELTQNENTTGTNTYSLRFPRFLRVREDKAEPSETIETYKNEPTKQPEPQPEPQPKPKKMSLLKTFFYCLTGIFDCFLYLIACLFGISFLIEILENK